MRGVLAGRGWILATVVAALSCTSQPPAETRPPTDTPPPASPTEAPTPRPTTSESPDPTAGPTATPDAPAEHRIGVRYIDGIGEFFDRETDEKFLPRGNNLIRLDAYHNTFNPGAYDAGDLEAQLARMAELGYNVVRVFLDHRLGGLTAPGDSGLSDAYLDNMVDFLHRARAQGIYVMFTQDWLPDGQYGIDFLPDVEGININYLTRQGIDQNARYFADLVAGLIERDAPLDAIWSYQLRNELFLDGDVPPFSLAGGLVKAPNGTTYDLTDPAERRALLAEGIVFWIDELRAAILDLDPTALVSVGFFEPHDPNPSRVGDSRLVETREALADSSADFIDLHGYPGASLPLPLHLENFGLEPPYAKPVVMGEMGAFRHVFGDVEDGMRALISWQADTCPYGFDGWLLWTWDSGGLATGVWNGTDADSVLADGLAPVNRPDPCSREGGVPVNLAFGRPTRSSNELADSPSSAAVDGQSETIWNSGDYAEQWIEVELAEPLSIGTVRLVVSQSPEGRTVHRVYGRRAPGSRLVELATLRGDTADGAQLVVDLALDAPISVLRIETVTSPSWVAWREIEVNAGN